jgi:predicted ATPase/DNA-binding SARP family transcriptional activator
MSVDRTDLALSVHLLGPLRLRVGGAEVEVPGSRRRALLAVLALAGGRVVGAERLVDALWPDGPPDNAVQALYSHVSRLRGHLGSTADRLERSGGGYRLRLEPDELDVAMARRLVSEAHRDPDPRLRLQDALALWRGMALEEFRALPQLEVEAVALDELRMTLVDQLLEARLEAGDHHVTADAAAAAAAEPLRERTALALVRALATEGRTAEAMAAAHGFRRRLADETGLDAGPALRRLEQEVAAGEVTAGGTEHVAVQPLRTVAPPDGPMVGREPDRDEVLRLLGRNAIVTLAGPGGVGKTRLALDVAADPAVAADDEGRPRDVVVVDLSSVDRPERVCQAVASTLALRTPDDVGPEDVARALANRRLLLVLDNCEHLADACRGLVVAVRRVAAGVRVLATSRATLHVPGEYVVRLQPLALPRPGTDLASLHRQPAVGAFLEHARRLRPGFDLGEADATDVVEVLRRVDGLPLGIELAARQASLMPVHEVRARLDRALDLATGRRPGADGRQRTLRATIASSYLLLDEQEQALLRAVAPFPGGVDLRTVEALAGDAAGHDPLDLLHRLVDASLLVADADTGRYRLLATVRAFLLDELEERGERRAAETRFLERCLAMVTEVGSALVGPDEARADRRLRAELDNLRAARDVAQTHGRDDARVAITAALGDAATWRGLPELWAWALELAADPALGDRPDRAQLLGWAAEAARQFGQLDRATALADEAFVVAGPDPSPEQVGHAWAARGAVAHFRGDFRRGREGWSRAADCRPPVRSALLASAALAAAYGGEVAESRRLLDLAHAEAARAGSMSQAALAAYVEGELLATDQVAKAIPYYAQAIEAAGRAGAVFIEGVARVAAASAHARTGNAREAAREFVRVLDEWRRIGQSTQLWTTSRNAAVLLRNVGHPRVAALLVLTAEEQPGAAAVSPAIARRSGRAFVPVEELVDPAEVEELREEARRLGPSGVLDLARRHLVELAAAGADGARAAPPTPA